MDGRDRVYDNIFVERLWRTVKYEEVYLHHYEDLDEAWARLGRYFAFYNRERPHQSLGRRTPHEAYFDAREATGGPEIAHAVSTPVALRAPSVATAPHTASSLNHPNSGRDIGKGFTRPPARRAGRTKLRAHRSGTLLRELYPLISEF